MSARPEVWRRRSADRLVAFVVPDHDEQVARLLVGDGGQDAEIEHHPTVGIERHDPPVRQPNREAECLRRHAAELLLE